MATFERNLSGYPLLGQTPIDSRVSNYEADGFSRDPTQAGWLPYGQMKTILLRVLSKHVFDMLFRPDGSAVSPSVFHLASTIVMSYNLRFDPGIDLQTTLIANVVAARCNLSVNHRARAFSFCDKLVARCEFEREYVKRLKAVLIDGGVLETPWWTMVKY